MKILTVLWIIFNRDIIWKETPCLGNYILFPESQLQISQNVFLKLSAWIVLCPAAAPPGSSPVHVAFLLTVPI